MKPRLCFDLPILRPATQRSFDTKPTAVAEWLAALPLASLGETCRQIFVTLYEVNRTQVPVAERLEFLERLAEPLTLVLPSLQRHFVGQPYPLPEKGYHVARLSTDLQVELVIGYRLVLEGLRHQSWLRRWRQGPHKALAAHRMLHYLSNILSDYQWQHMPYPRGVWHTVHRIFRHEGRMGRARAVVPRLPGFDGTSTVVDEYKRLLLRSLISPSRINAEQWRLINEQLDQWLPLLDLDATSVEYGFLVRLSQDAPPTELPVDLDNAMKGKGKFTVLDPRRLIEHLTAQLAAPDTALPHETLETLRNVWSGARGRHAERRRGQGQELELLLGVSTVYHMVNAGAPRRRRMSLALEQLPGAAPPGSKRQAKARLEAKSWANSGEPESLPKPAVAHIVDQSESGFGLQLPAAAVQSLKEGEIAGLRLAPNLPWEVGYVCWLRAEGDAQLALGVQHLAVEVLPVEVTVGLEGGHSAPIGCLLGTTASGETALFMPHLAGVEQKHLELGYNGHATPIVLSERLDSSADFVAFLFDVPEQPTAHTASSPESREALRHKLEAPVAAIAEADRYDDVWDSL